VWLPLRPQTRHLQHELMALTQKQLPLRRWKAVF
jgi:hypothetical protein